MNLIQELYLGVIIGLLWSFRSLMTTLPGNKLTFLFNCYALYRLLGGLSYGKLKLAIGILSFLAFRRSDRVLDLLWAPASAFARAAFDLATDGVFSAAVNAVSPASTARSWVPPLPAAAPQMPWQQQSNRYNPLSW